MIDFIVFLLVFAVPLLCCVGIIYFDNKYTYYTYHNGWLSTNNTSYIPWLMALFGIACYFMAFCVFIIINFIKFYVYIVDVISKLI